MRGTFRIGFYLARDTAYRWVTRMSSPLARLAVVFFLSLCGLVFLSNYVLSIKLLRKRIHRSGADLIVATEYMSSRNIHQYGRGLLPYKPDEYELYSFNEPYSGATIGKQHYPVVEYMPDSMSLFPATRRNSFYLLPSKRTEQVGPAIVNLEGFSLEVVTIPEKKARLLRRIYQDGAVFVPYGSLSHVWDDGYTRRNILRIKSPTVENVKKHEEILRQLARLDKRRMSILSSGKLLEELNEMLGSQYTVRVGVTLGISAIICLLLTCISSLEFRQNRYVYALIGSFGINRFLLFLSFIIENTILVALGFAGALATIWGVRDYITEVLYKSPDITLSLIELEADIRTFCLAFGICILVSSVPIGIAAMRPIGKVLH
ncbi:MAG: hypothetical protein IKZ07_02705 [Akkermansia sp.]|nr:hypothetical protein [Akkermansia sp.]